MNAMATRRGGMAALALLAAGRARGQAAWPSRPVRMVVPFPPGGLADAVARPLSVRLAAVFGQPFVIDNRPGAGGNVGADAVAKAEPDGHTLLVGSLGPLAVNQWLFPSLPFDPRAFAPVSLLIQSPKVVCVNPARPWRTLAELTEAARAAPGRLTAGSAGNGSSLHIALELYKRAAGVDVTHVPYRGAAAAITDLVGGQLDMIVDNVPNILPQLRAGAVRPLATATEARLPQLPDVPTTAEAGLPALRFSTWFGLVAPPGTPPAVTERLSAAVDAALREPEIGGRLAEQGAVPGGGTPEAFGRFMEAERARLEPVVRGSGMRAD